MNRVLFEVFLPIAALLLIAANSLAYEPIYRTGQNSGSTATGLLESNPIVSLRGDLTSSRSIRTRTNERPQWIISGDVDGDGVDEALVLFENGSLRLMRLGNKTISTIWTVEGISPQSPPLILHSKIAASDKKILVVSDRGVLKTLSSKRGRSSRVANDFSLLAPLVAADLDGDGTDEILGINDEGDRKSTRLNSSHIPLSRMPSSA